MKSSVKMTSIRLDTKLADEAIKAPAAKATDKGSCAAVQTAVLEAAARYKSKTLGSEHDDNLTFEAHEEQTPGK